MINALRTQGARMRINDVRRTFSDNAHLSLQIPMEGPQSNEVGSNRPAISGQQETTKQDLFPAVAHTSDRHHIYTPPMTADCM